MPNKPLKYLPETNRLPTPALSARHQFGRAVHAKNFAFAGGRSRKCSKCSPVVEGQFLLPYALQSGSRLLFRLSEP
jgi:hypothetical protein